MSVSDLSGTRWLVNETFDNSAFSTSQTFYIYYSLPNTDQSNWYANNCDALTISSSDIGYSKDIMYTSRSSYSSSFYATERLWYIWGGKDTTNQDLIDWLELNAVLQEFESEEYLTNTYDLTQVANAIRKTTKNYTLMSYPSGMVDTLENMGDFWTIEQLMSTDSLGDLYYNGSRTTIPDGAFAFKRITTASFPNCTTISNYAFYSCTSLTTVSFPSCTSIGNYAFTYCYSLTTVSFPSCTSIGNSAFQYCSSLTTVSFPKCEYIGNYAFTYCSALTITSFPSCTTIGTSAFRSCYSLSNVSFPNCTSIGGYAFVSCYNLISLNLTGVSVVPSLQYSNTFSSTPIGGYSTSAGQYGSIYVPASLYDAFINTTNWAYFSSRMVSV